MACHLMGLKWHMLILNIPIVFHTMRSVYVQIMRLSQNCIKRSVFTPQPRSRSEVKFSENFVDVMTQEETSSRRLREDND